MTLSDFIANDPSSPFRDPVAGETAYIAPATMRAFAQAVSDAVLRASAMLTLDYSFNGSTTPQTANGQLRLDTDDQTAATRLWLSSVTGDGVDTGELLLRYDAGSTLRADDRNDATRWQRYAVIGEPTLVNPQTVEFPVVWQAGGAELATQALVVVLVPST